jgi:mono/diheme cytochrome c family protein
MTKRWIIGSAVAALAIAGAAAAFAVTWRPAIAAIEQPSPQSFDPALFKRGRDLAAIGNCNDCHTVRGGRDFAGGLAVPTPFGTIYSSNITPDAETGIGRWPEAAFRRAMRSGVDRDGRHLYPTFPYDHFTNVSDEDDSALYAYLMTRTPVRFRSTSVLSLPAGSCCFFAAGSGGRIRRRARNGIAAPIWSKGWRIVGPAIPRAMR